MSDPNDIIRHPGLIDKLDDGKIHVKILSQSACASCNSKSMCSVSEMEEKIVEVPNDHSRDYKPGEQVQVVMKKSLAPKAVFLGYFLPFLVVLASLITLMLITGNEGLSALVSLGFLIPYYLIIYRMRDKLGKTFTFTIE